MFYTHARELSPPRGSGKPKPIRESRPNFRFVEQLLAKRLGGEAEDHTQLALAVWATLHGTTTLLLSKSIPDGHEEELRKACRAAMKTMLEGAGKFSGRQQRETGAWEAASQGGMTPQYRLDNSRYNEYNLIG